MPTSRSRAFALTVLLLAVLLLGQGADLLRARYESPLGERRGTGILGLGGDDYRCEGCNVILISIDTLRGDHVGVYGYPFATTPEVDEFAAEAVVFSTTIAHAPSTLASHASIFTSLIPEQHTASHSRQRPLPDEALTMAEILQREGLRTAAFTDGAQLNPKWNVQQGFDRYYAAVGPATHESHFEETVQMASEWLDEHGDEQFFLFLHTYEVHAPYTPRPEYLRMFEPEYDGVLKDEISRDALIDINNGAIRIGNADRAHIVATYDGELRSVDDAFGVLLEDLRERGLYDNTMIVFTSDHGEEFNERGWMGWHTRTLYDELLKVPMIIKFPGSAFAGSVVEALAQQLDLLPTMLDVLGIEVPSSVLGRTLLPRVRGRDLGETFAVSQQDIDRALIPTSVRTLRWKFLNGSLFDLAEDPLERIDVIGENSVMASSLEASLAALTSRAGLEQANQIELDEELREQLRALGYIQ